VDRVSVPRQTVAYDERRNTSRVFPVDPAALPAAVRAMQSYRAASPADAAWLEAGAPPINSQAEHFRWFGREYVAPTRRKARP
jgi:hypothetical protein